MGDVLQLVRFGWAEEVTNSEIEELIAAKHLSVRSLEDDIADYSRAVRIRRKVLKTVKGPPTSYAPDLDKFLDALKSRPVDNSVEFLIS